LRVLLPNDRDNYYRQRDLLPPDMMQDSARPSHHHYFTVSSARKINAGKLTKDILGGKNADAFQETPIKWSAGLS